MSSSCGYYYLEFEVQAGNAFIEVLERTDNTKLSFEQIRKYGVVVLRTLQKAGLRALIPNKGFDGAREFEQEWVRDQGIYDIINEDGVDYLSVREGLDRKEVSVYLRENIRAYSTVEMLLALTSDEAVSSLGIEKENPES